MHTKFWEIALLLPKYTGGICYLLLCPQNLEEYLDRKRPSVDICLVNE